MQVFNLIIPKNGEADKDCEDRLGVATGPETILRAAVADGATSTAFSGEWAALLVNEFCDSAFQDWDDFYRRCGRAAKRWKMEVLSQQRPWHALLRSKNGAAAAFAGIELSLTDCKWKASALGDSCVFHVRSGRIICSLPPYLPEDFGHHPRLMSTDSEKNVELKDFYKNASGAFENGDKFILATDAVAEALLRADRNCGEMEKWTRALSSGSEIARRYIQMKRASEDLQDDDVAIVVIEI